MDLPGWLGEPEPVSLSIETSTAMDVALDRLEAAIRERRYVPPGRDGHGFVRFSGTVEPTSFRIRARPYVIPGVRAGSGALLLHVDGTLRVLDGGRGTAINGWMSAPNRRGSIASTGVVLLAWLAIGLVEHGATSWFSVLFFPAIALLMLAAIRHGQRSALRRSPQVRAALRETIESGPVARSA